jgi:hypothetical protein
MSQQRGGWYLITGLLIGLLAGVVFSLFIIPVKYTDTEPYTLRSADKQIYRGVIASAYLVEADTNRALVRLGLLRDVNPSEVLISDAQNLVANNGNDKQARALALLAAAVNQPSIRITPIVPIPLELSPSPESASASTPTVTFPTRTPFATLAPLATRTAAPTLGAAYILEEQSIICDPLPVIPLIEIYVENAAGEPVAGEGIEISTLNGGVETFYTGLYPEISLGYADYEMLSGMVYALRVGTAGTLIFNLSIPACQKNGESVPGSIKLVFKQP